MFHTNWSITKLEPTSVDVEHRALIWRRAVAGREYDLLDIIIVRSNL